MNQRQHRNSRRPAHGGFTLIELLIAMSVTIALLALAVMLTSSVTKIWSRTSDRLAVEGRARLILDQLELDFQSIVCRRDEGAWLIASIQADAPPAGHAQAAGETWIPSSAGTIKPTASEGSLVLPVASLGDPLPGLDEYRFGQAGVWLRFISNRRWSPAAATGLPVSTMPVAVAYQLARRAAVADSPPVYQLFRSQVGAPAVFDLGPDLAGTPDYWNHDDTPEAPGNIRQPPVEALLAEHVIDFGVRLLVRTPAGDWRVLFPEPGAADYAAAGGTAFPEVAEIMLRILTDEGARQIARLEHPPDGVGVNSAWWDAAERHSLVFTRRISIFSRAR